MAGMADRRPRDWLAPVVVVALLLIPPVAYVAGYFTLCRVYLQQPNFVIREYPYVWMRLAYDPAADVEEALTGEVVVMVVCHKN